MLLLQSQIIITFNANLHLSKISLVTFIVWNSMNFSFSWQTPVTLHIDLINYIFRIELDPL